jgi:acetyl-CoA carboxylase carboxyltransferase component
VILMVEGTSFMGLGGANLVKGATGQTIDNETLGGAMTHNSISGVAHFRTKDEQECITKIRELVSELPSPESSRVSVSKAKVQNPRPKTFIRYCRRIIGRRTTCTPCSTLSSTKASLMNFRPTLQRR